LPIVPIESQSNITLREERGNAFITFLKERRAGDCVNAKNSGKDSGTSEETIPEGQAVKLRKPLEEDDWKAVFGKTERTV